MQRSIVVEWVRVLSLAVLAAAGCSKSTVGACADVDCGGHGVCGLVDGEAACLCEEGFHPEGLVCIEEPIVYPCAGVGCSGHGRCALLDGEPICLCDEGFHSDGLACLEDVVVDPCEGVDCPPYSHCQVQDGEPRCLCDEGYESLDALTCIPSGCGGIPEEDQIGSSCTNPEDCAHSDVCQPQYSVNFEGEVYIENFGGSCMSYGLEDEVCSPTDPAACPDGTRCIFLFELWGQSYHGCLDACAPFDGSGNQHGFNCGCREGYRCDPILGVCLSGCSNDRECCEAWNDLNESGSRDTGEVTRKEGCTNVCDNGGLAEGEDPEDFAHSFACINNGDPANTWGGPCPGDAWCPPDGRCLTTYTLSICIGSCFFQPPPNIDPYVRLLEDEDGTENFPGGYCTKGACDHAGRGCSEHGGACGSLKTPEGPLHTCLGTCRFGKTIDDPDYACRSAEGQEQACVPVEPDFWIAPPTDEADGYCWPGNFAGGTEPVGSLCDSGGNCESPYGLGHCFHPGWFCSVHCSAATARDFSLCGGDDGTGTAMGACFGGACLEACTTPGATMGESDCIQADSMVCYPTSLLGSWRVQAAAGLDLPPGLCMPRCRRDADCAMLFSTPHTCDAASGFCL